MSSILRYSKVDACLRLAAGVVAAVALLTGTTLGQTADDSGIKPNYVRGEVAGIDVPARQIVVRTGAGDVVAEFNEKTIFVRVPPGETSLEKAEPITLEDISVGDRVLAQGQVSADRKSLPARRFIVMTKSSITEKQTKEQEAWKTRGISGLVQSVDAQTKSVIIKVSSPEGTKLVTLNPNGKTSYRRYASGSVRFADSKPGKFEDIKAGDLVRALGEKSKDGLAYSPEMVISGTFMMAGGPVTKVMPDSNEIVIQNLATKKPLTVVIGKDSVVRRLPPPLANMLAARLQGSSPGGSSGTPGEHAPSMMRPGEQPAAEQGAGNASAAQTGRPSAGGTAVQGGPPSGGQRMGEMVSGGNGQGGMRPGGNGRGRMMAGDLSETFDRLPPITIAEIPVGEVILVSCAASPDDPTATAIMLAAGAEPILTQPSKGGGSVNYSFPSGVLDMGAGLGMGNP